jgi:hypothetical protein
MNHPDMSCIACGQDMEPGNSEAGVAQRPPLPGLLFYTRGQTGSSVFSPTPQRADYEHLVIGVCNLCLIRAGEERRVAHGQLTAPPGNPLPGEWSYTEWKMPPPARLLPLEETGLGVYSRDRSR